MDQPICHPEQDRCVTCLTTADCGEPSPDTPCRAFQCNTTTNECEILVSPAPGEECPTNPDLFCESDGRCYACVDDGQCNEVGLGFCTDHQCVQCKENNNCDDLEPCTDNICGTADSCQYPNKDRGEQAAGCPMNEAYCDGQGECVACTEDAHCNGGTCMNDVCVP
jgi:hypothetical protein